jgi:hypothetical protein
MSEIAGVATNGFNYTATYDPAATKRLEWAATFRLGDIYWSARHERLFQVAALTQADLLWTVLANIEETPVDAH